MANETISVQDLPGQLFKGCLVVVIITLILTPCLWQFVIEKQAVLGERIRLVDQDGNPIEGATLEFTYAKRTLGSYLPIPLEFAAVRGGALVSDANGIATYNGYAGTGRGYLRVDVSKEGYRSTRRRYRVLSLDRNLFRPYQIVMEKRAAPVIGPKSYRRELVLPEYDVEYGFDFMVGDLISPHGQGREAHAYVVARQESEAIDLRFPQETTGVRSEKRIWSSHGSSSLGNAYPYFSDTHYSSLLESIDVLSGGVPDPRGPYGYFHYFNFLTEGEERFYGGIVFLALNESRHDSPELTFSYVWNPTGETFLK